MPPLDAILPFIAAALLLAIAPGPDNLYVLATASLHGAVRGVVITLGLCSGLFFHTAAVALGLASLYHSSAIAFTVVKVSGGLYLLFLAFNAWRDAAGANTAAPPLPRSLPAYFRRGLFMNITNPKVTLFFLAFLPQFASPANGPLAPQIAVLGAVFLLCAFTVFSAIALLAAQLGRLLRQFPALYRILNRATAVLFAALALKLLFAQR